MRKHSFLDSVILEFDKALQTRASAKSLSSRDTPQAKKTASTDLDEQQNKLSARLMRVNHSGEVAAQALYQGQAFTAKLDQVREQMQAAADEEIDHLAWCEDRLESLGAQPSLLNPLWYAGSFTLGAVAGLVGDKWSLGFVAETEKQVVAHLQEHLEKLPPEDVQTRAIIQQMQSDEAEHGELAKKAGAAELPFMVKTLMRLSSKLMTKTSYWI